MDKSENVHSIVNFAAESKGRRATDNSIEYVPRLRSRPKFSSDQTFQTEINPDETQVRSKHLSSDPVVHL